MRFVFTLIGLNVADFCMEVACGQPLHGTRYAALVKDNKQSVFALDRPFRIRKNASFVQHAHVAPVWPTLCGYAGASNFDHVI